MRKVSGSVLHCPILHCVGYGACNLAVEASALVYRLFERAVNGKRKSGFHYSVVKNKTAEII